MTRILIAIFSVFILISCNSKTDSRKTLSVTIEPQKYFMEKLVGDKYTINSVVPPGANPESFDMAPSQLIAISKSEAFFKVGFLGIENTLVSKIGESNPNIKFYDCSIGIEPLDHHDDCDEHSHHGGGHDGADPHTWSAPSTAKVMVRNMYEGLIQFDEANKDYYTENYNNLIATINKTDSIIKSYVDKSETKSFIIYHPALSYFAKEYGLTQYTIEFEGKNPSPLQLKDLIDTAKDKNINTVLIQQEFDVKNAETVANAINGKAVVIDLMNYDWNEEMIKIAKAITNE